MELFFEERYSHPIEKVWVALTTSKALDRWLMRNDFEAEVGRSSVFRFCAQGSDEDRLVHVTVEALDPPRFMKWRWRHEDEANDTIVTFELEPEGDGTVLRLRHIGDVSPFRTDALRDGWRSKLHNLEKLLGSTR